MSCNLDRKKLTAEAVKAYQAQTTGTPIYADFLAANPSIADSSESRNIFKSIMINGDEDIIRQTILDAAGIEFKMGRVNQQYALKLVQENLVNQGFEITDEINAYIKEALQNSQAETAHVKVLKWFNGGRPIDFKKGSWAYRVIKDTGLTMVQIKDFFLAKHAPVRNEIGREIWQKEWDTKYLNLLDLIANSKTKATKDKYTALLDEHMQEEPPIAKSGMPTTEADKQLWIDRAKKAGMSKEYIEAIENTPSAEEILGREEYQKQGLEDTLKKYHAEFKKEVIDSATKRSVESGRISQESADSINSMEWYMPLKVDKASAQEIGIEIECKKRKVRKEQVNHLHHLKG